MIQLVTTVEKTKCNLKLVLHFTFAQSMLVSPSITTLSLCAFDSVRLNDVSLLLTSTRCPVN